MFLCFLSFCGLSSPDCIGFGVYWSVCFRFFLGCPAHSSEKNPGGNIQPTDPGGTVPQKFLEGISSLQIPKNPGGNTQPTDPKKTGGNVPQKILDKLSSPQFPKNCRDYPVHTSPKKSWKDYPVHSSQKNPGGTIQSTVPKKTLQRLSSPHFPKKPCRDYPVHTSQKNPGGTIQSTVPKKTLEGLSSPQFPKKPCKDYPVHTSQKKPAGTIQSTLPKKKPAGTIQSTVPKKILEGLSSPQFPKKNPDAFSPSAGLRFAKPSLHRSVPGILPAVLVPAGFFFGFPARQFKKKGSPAKNLEGSVRPKANLFQFGFQPTHFPNPPIAIALQPHAALHCLISQPAVVGHKAEVVASSAETNPSSGALHCKPVIP